MTPATAQRRPVTIRDLLRYKMIEDQALSPDGLQVAFTVTTIEGEEHRYRGAIWIVPTEGGEPRRLTWGEQGDGMPRWHPDGTRLAFRSDRGKGPQVYVLDLGGGEARPITAIKGGISGFAWSPDGERLVVTATGEEAPKAPPEQRRITRLHFRGDGVGLLTGAHSHLWLVDLEGGAEPRQLTESDEDDAEPAWSPDGRRIAYARTRPAAAGAAPFMDVWVLDVAGGEARNLTQGRGPCFRPTWSPDGTTLAFAHHTEPKDIWWGKDFGIWTIPAAGGEPTELTAGFGRIAARAVFGDPWRGVPWPCAAWSADGRTLFFLATDGGTCQLNAVAATGGNVRPITDGAQVVTDFAVAGDGIVYGAMTTTEPTDLWFVPQASGRRRRLTDLNAWLREDVAIAAAEKITLASFDRQPIDCWLIAPPGFDPNAGKKHPLILSIHGGPHGAYGEAYHHAFQALAGTGAFVLYVNPRGSQGYGEAFARRVIGDWGGGDFQDLMAAVDHVVARGHVDERRLGAIGGSYGGFMTTWISGHTDRFTAIVSEVPVTDLISFYGTSDIGHYFAPFEMGGVQPWEERERYVRMSPLTYAEQVTTPLLLIHHENDLRCPIAQSEQFYVTLKSLGKTVEFLRVGDASHGIVPPSRAHAELIDQEAAHEWFGRYLGLPG